MIDIPCFFRLHKALTVDALSLCSPQPNDAQATKATTISMLWRDALPLECPHQRNQAIVTAAPGFQSSCTIVFYPPFKPKLPGLCPANFTHRWPKMTKSSNTIWWFQCIHTYFPQQSHRFFLNFFFKLHQLKLTLKLTCVLRCNDFVHGQLVIN